MQPPGTTLLVIDDDDKARQSLSALLEGNGYDVLQATNAGSGLTLFNTRHPELILCDLQLGDNQGFELVRQMTESAHGAPVIVMSADGAMNDVVQALRLGASDFLLNPLNDPEVLEHAVRRALDRYRLRLENERIRERLERANRELEVHLKELRDDQAAGHQVQLNMLPVTPWVSGEYTLEHKLIPSLYLSGDFVDYFRVSDSQLAFYLADVSGHGSSSGEFESLCISDWLDDSLNVINALTTGPQILVGSSMGGWISFLLAKKIPKKIKGIVGIAAAPDFTEDGFWNNFSAHQKQIIEKVGYLYAQHLKV